MIHYIHLYFLNTKPEIHIKAITYDHLRKINLHALHDSRFLSLFDELQLLLFQAVNRYLPH
jgi:hypothetical protein